MHGNMRRALALIAIVAAAAAAAARSSATATGTVPKRIGVPGLPLAVAAGYDSLWVAGHEGTTLFRIDLRTGRIRARIEEGTNACGPLGIAFGRVWIGHCDTTTTDAVIDAKTNRLVGRVKGLGFGFGFGSAWIDAQQANPSLVNRIDARTLRVHDRLRGECGICVSANRFMWIGGGGTISRIDPRSNRVLETVRYGGNGTAFGIAAAGKIWIQDVGDNALYAFDPRSKKTRKLPVRLSFSSDFGDPYIAVAGTHLWFGTHNLEGHVDRLAEMDTTSGKVVRRLRVPSDFGPYFAVVNGSLWGSLPEENTVVRIPLK